MSGLLSINILGLHGGAVVSAAASWVRAIVSEVYMFSEQVSSQCPILLLRVRLMDDLPIGVNVCRLPMYVS